MKKSVLFLLVLLAWAGSSQAQYILPFTETFESTSSLPAGWVSWQSAGSGDFWAADFGMTTGCAFSWYDGTIWLISKAITVPAGGSVDISYYQKDVFPTYYVKHGLYYSTTGAQNLGAWTAINADLGAGDWNWAVSPTYTLTGYSGTTVYVAWEYEGSFADGWYIDNVHMEVTNLCPLPTAVNATAITASTATLGWTAPSPAPSGGYDIYYSTSSTPPTSSTVPTATVGAGITSYNMVSLSANTVYYAWVRSNCGGSSGSWTNIYSFTTLCNAVSVLPFNEGFESGYTDQASVGGCWTQDGGIYSYYWTANSSQTMFNRAPRTGSWDATLLHYGNAWMFRKFTLTGGMSYNVSCWARQDGSTPTDASIELKYGSVDSPAGMTGAIQSATGLTATYAQISGSFSPATSGDYFIGIHGVINGTPMYITLDDIQVSQTYSCFPPTAVTATAICQTSAGITWTPPASAPASGYDIYYSTSSTPPTISTTPTGSVGAGVTAYTMTPLTLGTTYYVWVRSNCGSGNFSIWSTVYSFSTHGIVPTGITVPGTYPNLTGVGGAFEAINCGGLNGNTTISITADLIEPGTIALNAWTENPAGSNYTLLIKPDASTLRTISGTLTYSASLPALIRTNGASRFTIDGQAGKYLTFRNTTPSPAATAGTILFNNSSTSCYLKNSTIECNARSTLYGTVAIGNTGNNAVEISGNDVRDATAGTTGPLPGVGIYCASATSSLSILNNNVYNFNNYGMLIVSAANGAVISGNSIFFNSPTAPTSAQSCIYLMPTTFNHLVTNNYIGGQAPLCQGNAWNYPGTADFTGMFTNGNNAGAVTVSNNIISNIAMSSSGASNFYGIRIGNGLFNITNNTVGSVSVAGSISCAGTGNVYGLYLSSPNPANTAENNIFGNWSFTAASGTPSAYGMYVFSVNARKNKIFGISAANAALTPVIYGIHTSNMNTIVNEFSNNIITLDGGAATNPTIKGFGNNHLDDMNLKLYYNTIIISGPPTGTSSTYAYINENKTNLDFKNNIFVNLRGAGGTGKHYAIHMLSAPTVFNVDYNDFYSVAGPLSHYQAFDQANLADWQTITGQDAHSISTDPLFVSSTDQHPRQPLLIAGIPVTGVTTDYAGITRATIPTMGAYELTQVATTAATSVSQTAAILNGQVNACSQNVVTSFEYGLTTSYGSSVAATPSPVTGIIATGITAGLTGLTINTLYHYRAVGTVGTAKYYGADMTFDLMPTPSITSGPTPVCAGAPGNVYTTQAGKSNYVWTVVGGTVTAGGTSASNTVTITWTTAGLQSVSVNYQNSAGVPGPSPGVYNVIVNPASVGGSINPAAVTIIIGSSTGTLTLGNYTGVIQKWQRRFNGGSYTDIPNTQSTYSEIPGAVGVYDYRVEVMSGNCGSAYSALSTVTVNYLNLIPGTVFSNASVCSGSDTPILTSTPPNGTSPTYQWQSSTDNVVFTDIAGQVGAMYNPGPLTATTYFRQMQNSTGTNGGPLPTNSVTITVFPRPEPTITGPVTICANSGYFNYLTETAMIGYTWTISPGGSITGGQGTHYVQVTWNTPGAQWIAVNYINMYGCTAATPTQLNVTVNGTPGAAGAITGEAAVCAPATGINYSVAPVAGATAYSWTLPQGASVVSGQYTNSIMVDFAANAVSGPITVAGNNIFGNGILSPSFAVTVHPQPATPVVTASGNTLTSSASAGNQWYWNGTAVTGATSQIYNVPAGNPGWYRTIAGLEGCYSDSSNQVYVAGVGVGDNENGSINIYPVPNKGLFTAEVSSSHAEDFRIQIYNTLGVMVHQTAGFRVNGIHKENIDMHQLPEGMYSLVFISQERKIVRKVLINR